MDTIRHLYRIGYGPSSSHTMGPHIAAEKFKEKFPDAPKYKVVLFGSLAATGRGHMTDKAIESVLTKEKTEIIWEPDVVPSFHPNGMEFSAWNNENNMLGKWMVYSIGGGALSEGPQDREGKDIYPHKNMSEILLHLKKSGQSFWEYVEECEGEDIWDYLREVWQVMHEAVERGIHREGVIPGGLGINRKAHIYYRRSQLTKETFLTSTPLTAYALAVSEENATGGKIVTAPTCGSCGVVPAILHYFVKRMDVTEENILRALATAAVFGNVAKQNGSISGAEVGCQGEVGVACSMAAAAASYFYSGTVRQIEYAAEMGLEHHLGLTCDPVCGLVQVPCIERNATAASAALYAAQFVTYSDGSHRVSYDDVIRVMMKTGVDMPSLYRETAEGGLASVFRMPNEEIHFKGHPDEEWNTDAE